MPSEEIAPSSVDPNFKPQLLESAGRILLARVLQNELTGSSLVDRGQRILLGIATGAARQFGIEAKISLPTLDVITHEAAAVRQAYEKLIPVRQGRSLRLENRDLIADEQTKAKVEALYAGYADRISGPTEEEGALAMTLMSNASYMSPEELRETLNNWVFLRAQDHATTDTDALLARSYSTVSREYEQMEGRDPTTYFVADWLTLNTVFTNYEGNLYRNVLWGFGSTELVLRLISEREDIVRIPYHLIQGQGSSFSPGNNGNGGSYTLQPNFPRYADVVRRAVGIFGRFIAEGWVQDVGGTVRITATGRSLDRTIVVRNPIQVTDILLETGDTARDLVTSIKDMQKNARLQNQAQKPLIRPNIVRALLPDPSILDAPTVTKDGRRDLQAEIAMLQKATAAEIAEAQLVLMKTIQRYSGSRAAWPPPAKRAVERALLNVRSTAKKNSRIIATRTKFLTAPRSSQ